MKIKLAGLIFAVVISVLVSYGIGVVAHESYHWIDAKHSDAVEPTGFGVRGAGCDSGYWCVHVKWITNNTEKYEAWNNKESIKQSESKAHFIEYVVRIIYQILILWTLLREQIKRG